MANIATVIYMVALMSAVYFVVRYAIGKQNLRKSLANGTLSLLVFASFAGIWSSYLYGWYAATQGAVGMFIFAEVLFLVVILVIWLIRRASQRAA